MFFAIGSRHPRWSVRPAWISGLETLAIAAAASGLTWFIGKALSDVRS